MRARPALRAAGPDMASDMPGTEATGSRVRVASRDDACRLIAEIVRLLGEFEAVLETETAHLRAGRLRQGLAAQERKAELGGSYLRAVQSCRTNAIALARFAPAEVATLRAAHDRFQAAVDRNQVVLATARAVSEGLVRGLAAEMSQAPQTYGATRQFVPVRTGPSPLACSRSY